MCVKHFREDYIEYTHKVPNGDGSFLEIARINPRLKEGAIPAFLPGHPSICSQPTTTQKRRRLSLDSKDEELLNETLTLSLTLRAGRKRNSKSIVSRISKISYLCYLYLKYGHYVTPMNIV